LFNLYHQFIRSLAVLDNLTPFSFILLKESISGQGKILVWVSRWNAKTVASHFQKRTILRNLDGLNQSDTAFLPRYPSAKKEKTQQNHGILQSDCLYFLDISSLILEHESAKMESLLYSNCQVFPRDPAVSYC